MATVNDVSVYCPFCHRHTAVSPAPLTVLSGRGRGVFGSPPVLLSVDTGGQLPAYREVGEWWIGCCNACRRPLLVNGRGHEVYPTPQPPPVAREIPDPMRADLTEALLCLSVAAYNGCVVLARRALQCAAIEQGASKSEPLWKQIKWLDDNRKITAQQRDWADAARWVGNHGAHDTEPVVNATGQPTITAVTREDAEDTIKLVGSLFDTLYVAGAAATAQIAKRKP